MKANVDSLVRELASLMRNKVRIPWSEFAKLANMHPEALRSRVRRYKGPVESRLTLDQVRARHAEPKEVSYSIPTSNIRSIVFTASIPVTHSFEEKPQGNRTWLTSIFLKPDLSNLEEKVTGRVSVFRSALEAEGNPNGFVSALRMSLEVAIAKAQVSNKEEKVRFHYKNFFFSYRIKLIKETQSSLVA